MAQVATRAASASMSPSWGVSAAEQAAEPAAELMSQLNNNERQALAEYKAAATELTAPFTDQFLMYFLWARKLEVPRAITLLQNHLVYRKKYDIDNMDMKEVKQFLLAGGCQYVPGKSDEEGRMIGYLFPRNFTGELMSNLKLMTQASWWLTMKLFSQSITTAREGMVYVEDFAGANLSLFMSMKNSDMKESMDAFQNAIPVRLRKLYIVHAPWYIRFLVGLAKPFMNKKLQDKCLVRNEEQIVEELGKDKLMREVGGEVTFDWQKYVERELAVPLPPHIK